MGSKLLPEKCEERAFSLLKLVIKFNLIHAVSHLTNCKTFIILKFE